MMTVAMRLKHWLRPERDPIGRLLVVAAVLALGVVIGAQYMQPDKRMLAVMAGAVVFGIAWRLDTLTGIGFLILALPYPRGTVFGSTNFAFILFLLLIWLLRVTQRRSPPPTRTPLDLPIVGLVMAYAISFYNINDLVSLGFAFQNTELFLVSLVMFYMVVSNVRTAQDLERLQMFQAVTIGTICLLAVFELTHPGGVFIPGWIEFRNTAGSDLYTRNVRVGGPFHDFEMLSEFCAISSLLIAFLILRSRTLYRRVALSGLLLLDVFVLFATVTRGGIVSLAVGLIYLLFLVRRRVNAVSLTLVGGSIAALAGLMNFYVSHFTRSGDIGARLRETTFVGVVPDSRVVAWRDGWNRFLEHPWIGHGPYYSQQTGTHVWFWPHNGYLYIANLVGLLGIVFYFALLVRLLMLSSHGSDDLRDPDYSRAFLTIANVQMVVFIVDQAKIDYLRNPIYQFEVWVMIAFLVSAYRLAYPATAREPALRPLPAAA